MLAIPLAGGDWIIDWDSILDTAWLFRTFGLPNPSQIELPRPLRPIDLPDAFTSLIAPPYNYEIADASINTGLDLITGDVFRLGNGFVGGHVPAYWVGDQTLALVLSGRHASAVLLCGPWGMHTVAPIYLDRRGSPDFGFARGQCLWLDRESLAAVFDDFLAGRLHPP
jgi:hypothetical protein